MSLHLFLRKIENDESKLHVLISHEDGSVALWVYAGLPVDSSLEGRDWKLIWSKKAHLEAGIY